MIAFNFIKTISNLEIRKITPIHTVKFIIKTLVGLVFKIDTMVFQPYVKRDLRFRIEVNAVINVTILRKFPYFRTLLRIPYTIKSFARIMIMFAYFRYFPIMIVFNAVFIANTLSPFFASGFAFHIMVYAIFNYTRLFACVAAFGIFPIMFIACPSFIRFAPLTTAFFTFHVMVYAIMFSKAFFLLIFICRCFCIIVDAISIN